ncbi:MAG TPA: M20 family metallopeptidase [Planctomycetota bacterium]|nr:M20 family metallopeptidase [Planctomycetota bacterium]
MIFTNDASDVIGRTVCDMLAIKALSGEEGPMADYVAAQLKSYGLDVERDEEDNVCAAIEPHAPGDPKQNTIHLSGHTDTVVPVEGWTTDPWKPEIIGSGDERKIVGLGASDMKSGLGIMLHLAKHFAKNRLEHLRILVSFTVCEEMPAKNKRNGVNKIVVRHPGRWAITTEASCDTTSPTIALGCQGHAVATVKLQGKSAHSARPDRGLNAISAAGKIAQRVDAMNAAYPDIPILGDVRARAAAAVTLIKGGAAANIIPEFCEMTISRRIAPGETKATVEAELAELTRDLGGVSAKWSVRNDAPACVVDKQGPLLKCASDAAQTLFGQARYTWNRARTDCVLFAQAGMDVINIGPGSMGQAHVAGESVRVADLPKAANLVAETMLRLDKFLAK